MKRLARHVGDTLLIGPKISVQLVRSQGTRVRIAIRAPQNVPIHRPDAPRQNRAPSSDETPSVLTLSRGIGECVLVGDDIEIHIIRHIGSAVEFGIKAPPDLDVRPAP